MSEQKPGVGGQSLFDSLPSGIQKGLNAHTVRQMFDGTVFDGSNGVSVKFDQNGEVMGIDSINLFTGQRVPSFRYGQTGGFAGEGGFYGESTVMGKRLNAIISETKSDWQMWKETENEHPGVDFRTWKSDRVKAMAQKHEELMRGRT